MIAKFTLVGGIDCGKTFTLRALTFILCKNEIAINQFLKPKWKVQRTSVTNLMSSGHKDFTVIIEYNSKKGTKRIGIGTGGDFPLIIRNNWDVFLCHDDKFEIDKKWEIVDLAISPCHPSGSTRDQEEYEQHAYHDMNFIYWADMRMLIEQAKKSINEVPDEIVKEMENAGVFMSKYTHVKKPNPQEKKQCIWIAQQIKDKIDQLFML